MLSKKFTSFSSVKYVPVGLLGLDKNIIRVFSVIALFILSKSTLKSSVIFTHVQLLPEALAIIPYTENEGANDNTVSPDFTNVLIKSSIISFEPVPKIKFLPLIFSFSDNFFLR